MQKTNRILQLESMRFIMCLIIMLSHLEFLANSVYGSWYQHYLHNPTMAVDYFFMLSGFGLYLSGKRVNCSLKECFSFAISKVRKIYPAYIISLIISIPYYFFSNVDRVGVWLASLKTIIVFGIDLTLLQSITGMMGFSHSLNGVAWFLSSLFICYIISPYFLKTVDSINWGGKNLLITFMMALTFTVLLSIIALKIEKIDLLTGIVNDLWYGHPVIRCWYLFFGMLVGIAYKSTRYRLPTSLELLVLLIFGISFLGRNLLLEGYDYGVKRAIDITICSSMLFLFSIGGGSITRILSKEKFVELGRLSMYLYLFHFPVRVLVDFIFVKFSIIQLLGEIGYICEVLLIAVFSTILVYKYDNWIN